MWETQVQSLHREGPLEKGMATHPSTLAWKIPWTEEPGRLQSMGSWRVGHDWATSHSQFFIWLCQALVAALRISIFVAACAIFSCCKRCVGSSSLTREGTQARYVRSSESWPLDHQGSPYEFLLWKQPLWKTVPLVILKMCILDV